MTCARCREQIETLQEELRQLREVAFPADWAPPPAWNLTPAQSAILCLLVARERVSQELMFQATRHRSRLRNGDLADLRTMVTQVCKLRAALRAAGVDVEIRNVWGQGYQLSEADRQRLKNWGKADAATPPP